MKKITKILLMTSALLSLAIPAEASMSSLAKRARLASDTLDAILKAPDRTIPVSLLEKAQCVVTVPHVVQGGFVFGGRYGKGLAACRVAGGWSDPVFVTIAGGSWGLQIGLESTDLILVFVTPDAINHIAHGNFTLGGDASVAIGPVGRNAEAGTDYKLDSEIFAYSRSRGAFAGLTVSGAVLALDNNANTEAYGQVISPTEALGALGTGAPAVTMPYVNTLMTDVH